MRRKTALVVSVGFVLGACSFQTDQFTGDGAPEPVTIGFAQRTSLQDEASNNIEVVVRLSRPAPEPITIAYEFAGGSAVADQDYEGANDTLSFQTGETEKGIPLRILPDAVEEQDETIELALRSPSAGAELGAAMHTITISHALLPRVNFSLGTSSGGESGMVTLNLTLDAAPLLESTVTIAPKMNTTAVAPYDYTMPSNATVTFPVGSTSQTIDIPITSDTADEDDEAFTIEIASTTNVVIGTTINERTHTIVDDDNPPSVSITTASGMTTEGDSGTKNVVVTVTLSAQSGKTITVPITYGGGTATENGDYSYMAKGDLVFNANVNPAMSDMSKTITILVSGDTTDEVDQTIITAIGTPTNATVGATASHTQTITDDDMAPTIEFTTANQSINEGDSGTTTTSYTMTLSAASEKAIMFEVVLSGNAARPDDYTTIPTSSGNRVAFTIAAGTTTAKLDLVVVGETLVEGADETIVMDLDEATFSNVRKPGNGNNQRRTHTIDDTDPN